MVIELTDQNFAEYQSQGKPMIIDFSASWCGPCKKMAPVVEKLSEAYQDQVIVGEVDIEANDDLVNQFGIRNVPTILFIKDGNVIDKTVGSVPESDLENRVQKIL